MHEIGLSGRVRLSTALPELKARPLAGFLIRKYSSGQTLVASRLAHWRESYFRSQESTEPRTGSVDGPATQGSTSVTPWSPPWGFLFPALAMS